MPSNHLGVFLVRRLRITIHYILRCTSLLIQLNIFCAFC